MTNNVGITFSTFRPKKGFSSTLTAMELKREFYLNSNIKVNANKAKHARKPY